MKTNPKVSIELDKERLLWLNFNAMALFEERTGKNSFQALSEPSASDIRTFLWSCLVHEDKDLTPEMVGELIDLTNINYVMDRLLEAYAVASPDKKGKKATSLSTG